MNGVLGATTQPPLLTNGFQVAEWLVGRNQTLRDSLTRLGMLTEYGPTLDKLRDAFIEHDARYRLMLDYNEAKARNAHHGLMVPERPGEAVVLLSHMSASERSRLRFLATLAPMTDDARMLGVEWSWDEVGLFADADPGLVADLAAAMVARFTGV